MKVTSKEFCKSLREQAGKIASGEEVVLRSIDLERFLEQDDLRKINASYIRMTLNRTPEIKEVGTVKVTRTDTALEGDGYRITINRATKRRVYTEKDIPEIKQRLREKIVKQIMKVQPKISDLKGDQLEGAAIALSRMSEMLEDMIKGGENEI